MHRLHDIAPETPPGMNDLKVAMSWVRALMMGHERFARLDDSTTVLETLII